MKYQHRKYTSELEWLQEVAGISKLRTERIDKPYHHKERVRVYPGIGIVKKRRDNNQRAINRTYNEANAHADLDRIGINIPQLSGILHSDKECSLFLQYIDSDPLTSLMVSLDSSLPQHLASTGRELGKMFEYNFLHGDLTSYHILVNGKTYLFDLETTRRFHGDKFYRNLIKEWTKFIDSTQGKRWKIPFSREQEEMIFEGARETLSRGKTLEVLENIVLRRNK